MYSPITPRQISCTPDTKQMMLVIEAQPDTVRPSAASMTAHSTPIKLTSATNTPKPVMNRMGLMDRLVMPSNASASILDRG